MPAAARVLLFLLVAFQTITMMDEEALTSSSSQEKEQGQKVTGVCVTYLIVAIGPLATGTANCIVQQEWISVPNIYTFSN